MNVFRADLLGLVNHGVKGDMYLEKTNSPSVCILHSHCHVDWCHCAGLAKVTILLNFHWCNFSAIYRSHYLVDHR